MLPYILARQTTSRDASFARGIPKLQRNPTDFRCGSSVEAVPISGRGASPCRRQSIECSDFERLKGAQSMSIFTILFVILLVAWIFGWGVFHIAGGMIHLLLIIALISLVLHFIRGPRAV
jgi:hypothetical protein